VVLSLYRFRLVLFLAGYGAVEESDHCRPTSTGAASSADYLGAHMTHRYDLYLQSLAQRDHTLVVLTALALSVVAALIAVDVMPGIPATARIWLRRGMIISTIMLYLITLFTPFGI